MPDNTRVQLKSICFSEEPFKRFFFCIMFIYINEVNLELKIILATSVKASLALGIFKQRNLNRNNICTAHFCCQVYKTVKLLNWLTTQD